MCRCFILVLRFIWHQDVAEDVSFQVVYRSLGVYLDVVCQLHGAVFSLVSQVDAVELLEQKNAPKIQFNVW